MEIGICINIYIYTYGKRLEQNTVAGHEVFLYHTIKSETHMYVYIYIYPATNYGFYDGHICRQTRHFLIGQEGVVEPENRPQLSSTLW